MDANQPSNLGLPTPAGDAAHPQAAAMPAVAPVPPLAPSQPAADQTVAGEAALQTDENAVALDQEWVDKAKQIVERTKGDPFLQSKELNKAKAGYLKARYNKDFKVAEDGA
jgi:hypothetical protein